MPSITKEITAAFSRAVPMMRRPGIARERFRAVEQQFVLVRRDFVDADVVDVIDRRAQSDAAGDIGRAGFELVGQIVVGGLLEGDGA
jgi:hypothetical protein